MTDDKLIQKLRACADYHNVYEEHHVGNLLMNQAADRLAALAPLGKLFEVMDPEDKRWGDVPSGALANYDGYWDIIDWSAPLPMMHNPIPPGTTILIPKEQRDGSAPARLFPMRPDARPGYPIDRKGTPDAE